jgi:hypothetical protein
LAIKVFIVATTPSREWISLYKIVRPGPFDSMLAAAAEKRAFYR